MKPKEAWVRISGKHLMELEAKAAENNGLKLLLERVEPVLRVHLEQAQNAEAHYPEAVLKRLLADIASFKTPLKAPATSRGSEGL